MTGFTAGIGILVGNSGIARRSTNDTNTFGGIPAARLVAVAEASILLWYPCRLAPVTISQDLLPGTARAEVA
jgi:hypothetical protein